MHSLSHFAEQPNGIVMFCTFIMSMCLKSDTAAFSVILPGFIFIPVTARIDPTQRHQMHGSFSPVFLIRFLLYFELHSCRAPQCEV